jgi:hypothetical protein
MAEDRTIPEKWVTGKIPLDREVKKINMKISSLLIRINPLADHYSTIPLCHVRGRKPRPRKISLVLNKL